MTTNDLCNKAGHGGEYNCISVIDMKSGNVNTLAAIFGYMGDYVMSPNNKSCLFTMQSDSGYGTNYEDVYAIDLVSMKVTPIWKFKISLGCNRIDKVWWSSDSATAYVSNATWQFSENKKEPIASDYVVKSFPARAYGW